MDKFKTPHEMCKGCMTYNIDNTPCPSIKNVHYIPDTLLCPCSTCILKVICVEPCEDFMDYIGIMKTYSL